MSRFSLLFLAACAGSAADNDVITSQCPEDVALFEERVWEPVVEPICTGCHLEGGVARDSDFLLDRDDMLQNLRAVSAMADQILLKPTGQHPNGHGGDTLFGEDSPEYAALAFWVAWTEGSCDVPEPESCGDELLPRRVRRLTHTEYGRTVADLLDVDASIAAGFAADPEVDGFRNDAEALVVHGLLADQYRVAAEQVSEMAVIDPGCTAGQTEAACAQAWLEDFGFRAFRRPLAEDELAAYQRFWAEVAAADGLEEGLRWGVTAMLQSPHFLYRSELGIEANGAYTLTDWEVATALSYAFWGTTPDAELLTAAEAGFDATTLQAQIERLGNDPRTLDTTADLVEVWLLLDRLATVPRDGLTEELRAAMAWETRTLVKDVAADDGQLGDLLHARHTFLDGTLAAHYGLAGTGRVELDGEQYGGLLRQGSVLTAHARPTGSSPVHRGVLVRERLLCEELPPPPANLDTSPPPVDPSLSTRERYEEHSANPECASCHDKIDPLGFGFEHYDGLGRWRATDGVHAVDDSGSLDGEPFVGLTELSAALEADARFRTCFAETWQRHLTGAEGCAEDPGDVGLTEPLFAMARGSGFAQRHGAPGEGDSLAVGQRPELSEPPDVETPPPDAFTLTISDDWGAGFCAEATVTNTTESAWTWEIRESADGTVNNIWNAEVVADGADWVFTGVEWNAVLEPGASASFGFCATR
ncbi:MAG: DUF1588 domain-containing protein [Deltaproteobacteria bacterium]|nr:MAG: DUF1588 domain-containing protein [Deltaproteobacteria bacterium]